ncbi:hypothetical protein QX51_15455 [Terrisporobacter othiniensis]|uniref:Phage protein n=1 Tax=Terrisporobacter othiniensis TaxID=1577792 RepID=A0A0B3VU56_9FIRM|nr:minor capsid protein [Terrisporobacter othiniensis]KHS56159.1 hypothetical protein QX51_15455 [Terrisporobacter othiniensis]
MLISKVKEILEVNDIKENITMGSLADSDSVGLFATAGQPATLYFDNQKLERPGLQVIVRNKSYEKGFEIIRNIYEILNKQVGFNPQQSPFYIGRDEKGNAEFSVNYIVYIED